MGRSRTFLLIAAAVLLARCGPRDPAPRQAAISRSPIADSGVYASVAARLRDAFVARDTAYCDSVLPLFDDTALARLHPDRVTDGFVSNLIGHDAPQPATMRRFGELARYTGAPVMRNWHGYVVARSIQIAGAPRLAIAEFEPLLERFKEDGDTVGMASVHNRIGNLYLDLDEPAMAAFHLQQARTLEPRVDIRSTITATLGRCYAVAGNADSTRWCAEQLMREAADTLSLKRGDDRAAANAGWLLHLAALLDTGSISVRQALLNAGAVDGMLQSRDPSMGFLVASDPAARLETLVLRARALLRLGRPRDALAALAPAEHQLARCPACLPQRIGYLAATAEAWAALGDWRAALRFQQERADVLAQNKTGRERVAVEQARAKAEREQQDLEAGRRLKEERTLAGRKDREHRMQRVNLVVMVGFVALFGALLFGRARLNRRIQLEQVRARLSRDLHDDIGATLSSINILSTVARRKAEAGDEAGAAASLTGISERTQRLMRNMSDIVWSVNPDHDSMEDLLVRMREFGAAVLEPKGINYHVESSGDLNAAVPPAVKSNYYLIFKEAVNNAAKHAGATEVTVCLMHEASSLRMRIADNGKGMGTSPDGNSNPGGNGLRNMLARAAEMKAELRMESLPGKGTTIELVVPV